MRFGRTQQQKLDARRKVLRLWQEHGIGKYSWRPVLLEDGTWIWFEHYRSYLSAEYLYSLTESVGPLFWIRITAKFHNIASDDALVQKLKG